MTFYTKRDTDQTMWVDDGKGIGDFRFSVDGGKTIYYLFGDYPWKLSDEEREIFDRENPFWVRFFGGSAKDDSPSEEEENRAARERAERRRASGT